MAARFNEMVAYFENLARKHVSIKHSDFEKHFYRFELDEVLTGMCSDINYPAFILEAYNFNYSDSDSDNILKKREGAFILMDLVKDLKDYDKIHEVWDEMEAIGDDFLIKMREDKESGIVAVMNDFDIGSCQGIPFSVSKLGQHGIRISFNMDSDVNVNSDNSKWL